MRVEGADASWTGALVQGALNTQVHLPSSRPGPALLALGLAFAALQLAAAWIGPYGLFHDELYYWANAKRPGLGYVDHPPFAPWILAATVALLGDGRLAFALIPALCGTGTVLLAGLIARRFGATRWGQLVAGLCVAVAPFNQVLFSFYSVNALEILCWTATCFLFAELIRTDDERYWLGIGVVAGVGLLNKHMFTLLAFGMAVAIAVTPLRAHLRRRWVWLGCAIALVIVSPNLYWNLQNGWPSLAFYRSRPAVDLPTSFAGALVLQIAGANPVAVLVWLPGLLYLLFARAVRPYRPLGVVFLALLVVILFSGQRRGDRIAGVYPVAFAAGVAFWDQWRGRGHKVVRWALPALLAMLGVLMLSVTLPLRPPDRVERIFEMIGQSPEIEAVDVGQKLPNYLMGRLDWERLGAEVAIALATLPPPERARAVVLTPHWVYASVIEYYGRDRDVAPVVAPHNAYYFWRHEAVGRDIAVSVAIPTTALSRYFAETTQIGMYHCVYCARFRSDMPIYLSRGPVRPIVELLDEWRHFSIEAAPALSRGVPGSG